MTWLSGAPSGVPGSAWELNLWIDKHLEARAAGRADRGGLPARGVGSPT